MRERAEPDRSASVAEAVLRRAWLPPSAASLTALARTPLPATWAAVRDDPGAVLLLLRRPGNDCSRPSFLTRMQDPAVLDEAVRLLDSPHEGAVDWNSPAVRPIYQTALSLATLARDYALKTVGCDPDEAWVCGLFAPLGWLGVCAAAPASVVACLTDPEFAGRPARTQRRHWGLDQSALGRRLARRGACRNGCGMSLAAFICRPSLPRLLAPTPRCFAASSALSNKRESWVWTSG